MHPGDWIEPGPMASPDAGATLAGAASRWTVDDGDLA